MVVFDASVLIDLFDERVTGDRRARIDHLIENLKKERTKILIPAPALTELMAKAGKAREEYQQILSFSSGFKITPFAARAAMECAILIDKALTKGDKRAAIKTWAKAKFDWQICAIAKVEQAKTIYSDDDDLVRICKNLDIAIIKIDDLPLPASARQGSLKLEHRQEAGDTTIH